MEEIYTGDAIYLCAEVKNISKRKSTQLRAISEANIPLFDQRQFVFGNLKPQEKKTWYVPITIPDIFVETTVFLKLNLFIAEGKKALSFQICGKIFFSHFVE